MTRVLAALVVLVAPAAPADLTCDPQAIDRESYRLTTEAQALNVTAERYSWWDAFKLGKHEAALADLNDTAAFLATRALEIDPGNLMGHALLARQLVVLGDGEAAEKAWAATLDAGGAVVWTATLYDVDARTYFALAFDRASLRIYRFGQLAGAYKKGRGGIPEFPGKDNVGFWASLAGCLPAGVTPEARVPWADVREIKAGNWVLWFDLARPVAVASDDGKRKSLGQIKVNLHGRTGTLEVYKPVGADEPAIRGRGPAGYQDLIRRTLVKFVDPEKRIALPPVKPGAGW
ncbi:MAG TPA: hypothetical protein VFM88_18760 [Vicinamibacteria bacterium]|nr:hypothetical protein [Vicinamibacteria bacterium]